jgi:hypothetical protein
MHAAKLPQQSIYRWHALAMQVQAVEFQETLCISSGTSASFNLGQAHQQESAA